MRGARADAGMGAAGFVGTGAVSGRRASRGGPRLSRGLYPINLHRHRFLPLALLALLTALAGGGCQILAMGAYKAGNDVPAAYKPPKVTTLVLAENWRDPASTALDASGIEAYVIEALRQHNAVPIADAGPLEDLRAMHPEEFHRKTLRELGDLVGAKQVIYIVLAKFEVAPPPGSEIYRGSARAMVRVVDVQSGLTLWPTQSTQGFPVDAVTSYLKEDSSEQPTELSVRGALQRNLSDKIAELFYTTSSDESRPEEPEEMLNK